MIVAIAFLCLPGCVWGLVSFKLNFAVRANSYARLLRVKCGTAACRVMIRLPGIVRFILCGSLRGGRAGRKLGGRGSCDDNNDAAHDQMKRA